MRASSATLKILAVVATLLLFSGCSSKPRSASELHQKEADAPAPPQKLPWEVWSPGSNLLGAPIQNFYILRGDRAFEDRDYQRALEYYNQAGAAIPADEATALALRKAGAYLAIGRAGEALEALDLAEQQHGESFRLDQRVMLVRAYAHGAMGEARHSLDLFAILYFQQSSSAALRELALEGAVETMRFLTGPELESLKLDESIPSVTKSLIDRATQVRTNAGDGDPLTPQLHRAASHVIGLLLPLTGRYAKLGESTKEGVSLALAREIESGTVRMVVRDSGGSAVEAEQQYQALLREPGISVILGPLVSDYAETLIPIARMSGVPLVTLSKRSGLQLGGTVFRFGPTARSQVDSVLHAASNFLGLRRYALIYPASQSGYEFSQEVRQAAHGRGLALLFESSFTPGDLQTLSVLIPQIEALDLDAIFFPADLDNAAHFYSNLSARFRSRVRLLGISSWQDSRDLLRSRTILEGVVFPAPFHRSGTNRLVEQFIAAYNQTYGEEPNFLAAQGYDLGTLVGAALRRADEHQQPFAHAFSSIQQYDGLTGEISISPSGEVDREFVVVQLLNGELQQVHPPSFSAAGDRLLDSFASRGFYYE